MGNSRRSISVPSQGGCTSFLFSCSSSPSWPFLSSPSRENQSQCVSPIYHSSFVTVAPSQLSKPVSDGSPTCRSASPFAFRGSKTRVSSLENSFDGIGFRGNSFPTTCCSNQPGSSGSSTKGWLQQNLSDDTPASLLVCQERPPAEAEHSPAFADTRRGTCRIPLHSSISPMSSAFREESSSLSVKRSSIRQGERKALLFPALPPLDLIDQPHPAETSVSWGKNGKEMCHAKPRKRATFDTDRSDSEPQLLDSSPARSFSSSVAFSAPSSFSSCASPNISRGKQKTVFRSMAFTPVPREEGNPVFASRPSLSFVGLGGVETTVATLGSTADEKSHERFVCSRGVKHFEWTIRKTHERKCKQTRRLGEKAATRGESGPLLIMSLHRLTRNMGGETTTVDPPRSQAFVPGPVLPSLFYRSSSCLSSPSSQTSEYRHPCEASPASSSLSFSPSSASLSPSSPFRCDGCCSSVSFTPREPNSTESEGKDEKEEKARAPGFFRETQSSRTLSETRRPSSGKEAAIAESETKLCLVSHALAASSSWSPSAASGSGLADEEMEETLGGLKAFSRDVLHVLEGQRKREPQTDHETVGEPKDARSLLASVVSPEFQKSNLKKAKSEERDETYR
ncbi:hypothetical protein TGPRC2_293020 [Toxoplasma gondii TgCatPRC2]|uniref:Uncharacterized protein n=9 Tax=Toxoplasma gondii TaxID=5811 RepID=V5B075_TOXGV|nr:hypothetical protein TGME49_293020 [Toxoplasma gondii ME49]EPR57674.1 hypothetical protein TGGT1_293020 [Toxoplasma gondii GT1]ESS29340.1 hypothetical protein TGVEG_293020 [Toxoplasma gondii VEG]KAF4646054.1 hypothetical protein TGRH88_018410 [Toxoplasma gondii]KFG35868.1 hypothetical protein TGP89_293020 [Toxoplasma gondii p89]KFH14438.1 hypothetical protein TGMAS_293020 [Toxoplasma gondii MAS]KYK66002.1 hypothetical protein TGPRC2_293020 [Toxoplasma gondii TgCatPRC2]PUA86959.1 hypotheti|eukprot:XP_002370114.1 hypothetical protein TGME49_293020 [Toxoplasma gondii ME49]